MPPGIGLRRDQRLVVQGPTSPVITALQERIKALKPTARAISFSTAFCVAFQLPPEQPSLAGLITTTLHQRWIEAFLL